MQFAIFIDTFVKKLKAGARPADLSIHNKQGNRMNRPSHARVSPATAHPPATRGRATILAALATLSVLASAPAMAGVLTFDNLRPDVYESGQTLNTSRRKINSRLLVGYLSLYFNYSYCKLLSKVVLPNVACMNQIYLFISLRSSCSLLLSDTSPSSSRILIELDISLRSNLKSLTVLFKR